MQMTFTDTMDELEKRVKIFFSDCKRYIEPPPNADLEFQSIRKEYYKVLEDADEKVGCLYSSYTL